MSLYQFRIRVRALIAGVSYEEYLKANLTTIDKGESDE
jgi:hypothetical protein